MVDNSKNLFILEFVSTIRGLVGSLSIVYLTDPTFLRQINTKPLAATRIVFQSTEATHEM